MSTAPSPIDRKKAQLAALRSGEDAALPHVQAAINRLAREVGEPDPAEVAAATEADGLRAQLATVTKERDDARMDAAAAKAGQMRLQVSIADLETRLSALVAKAVA